MRIALASFLSLCVGATTPASAADNDYPFHEPTIRLEASLLTDTLDVDATANSTLGSISRSGETEFEDAWRIGLIAVSAHRGDKNGVISFASGGGVQYSHWHDGGNYNEKIQALTGTLRLGFMFRPSEFFHLEAMPYGAIGGARGEIDDSKSDIGFYWEFGGIAGAFITLSNIQFGVHAGYLWNGTDLKFDHDANFGPGVDDVDVQFRGKGAFYGASIGTTF